MTINEAEYKVLIIGLTIATDAGVRKLIVRCDFQLVVMQVLVEYSKKD